MVRASTSTRSLSLSSTPIKEAAERTPNQLVVKGARCVITPNDGKFLAVLEECDYVRSLLEKLTPTPRALRR